MNTYRVTWTIDVEARSFMEAAREARKIQLDPESIATYFSIEKHSNGKVKLVDLSYKDSPSGEANDPDSPKDSEC